MFGLYSMLFINFNSSSSQYGVWIPIKNTIVKSGTVILENSNIILDLTSGNIFVINFTQDSTIEILNLDDVLADNNSYVANLKLTNAGNYTITWPENFKWAGGIPTFTTDGIDEICIIFYSDGQITVNYALDIK